MKKLFFNYRMFSGFTSMISDHSFTLKCIPESSSIQQVHILKQEISPLDWLSDGVDSFGYSYLYGQAKELHDSFSVEISGIAQVDRINGFQSRSSDAVKRMYRFPTALTRCSGEMREMARAFAEDYFGRRDESVPFRDVIYALMHQVFTCMEYCPGATDTHTTAAEAFQTRKGVCQDYAHIFIALCRVLGIPAVYVAGYMMGEGASHAWVAVYDEAADRWFEIDPTNDKWVDDDYISVSHGFDSSDCIMNKGIFRRFAEENQEITVIVEERE